MQYRILSVLLLVFALMVSGCGNVSTPISPTALTDPVVVEDQASLVAALQAAGATVEVGDSITQVFFSPEGKIIKVNGADVQVFEYENVEAMENGAPRWRLTVDPSEQPWSPGLTRLTSIKPDA